MSNKPVKRGLNALLMGIADLKKDAPPGEKVQTVSLDLLRPNPDQPRKKFGEEGLIELAESIRNHGIIQPLTVRKSGDGYAIIAGERRYRAAKMAKLTEVPIVVRECDENVAKELSLIENLQREDLNAIEEAEAISELRNAYGITQEEIAGRLGKSRSSVTNSLRLLNLEAEVIEYVRNEKLSAGHARALLGISDPVAQIALAKKAVLEKLSVREVEKRVKRFQNPDLSPTTMSNAVRAKLSAEMQAFVNDMTRVFSARVGLKGNENRGRIYIEYRSNDDLQRISEVIERLKP